MDSTTFRILDALSRHPGSKPSINGLVKEIRELGYIAHYKNIYDKTQKLKKQEMLTIKKTGNISLISLNTSNPQLIDQLTIMELEKKNNLLQKHPHEKEPIQELETTCDNKPTSIALINPEKNIKLNITEILYLTTNRNTKPPLTRLREIARKHNTTIHSLTLTSQELQKMLEAEEQNQAKKILENKIILANPAMFWKTITKIKPREAGENKPDPGKISPEALEYNLRRFGYASLTTKQQEKTDNINIETIIIACLLQGDARLKEAVPVLLAKNKINHRLLHYLALKHHKHNLTGYFIETTSELVVDQEKKKELRNMLKLFETYSDKKPKTSSEETTPKRWSVETKTSKRDLKEKMRLYNAI
ncbi:MAG: helix-turn-helix domain-containing protein [Candidatus Altiarchaeota archaeon]|nr:helix-turn-helix domain-containing protein [Candidatus Altiarchaeota archaeon]